MTENKINIALLQLNASNNFERNFTIAEKALYKAKESGADIALFPELWTTGYEGFPEDKIEQKTWKSKSIWCGHEKYNQYLNLSKEVGIATVFTFLESDKERTNFYNTAILIDSTGKEVLKYRKTHLVDKAWERNLTPGNNFPVTELKINNKTVKVGIMICYDREFPEVSRILMLEGAELILVPNACTLDKNRIAQFQTRAFENMLGVAMTNYCGKGFDGKSVAFDGMRKKGEDYDPLLIIGDNLESILYAKFDLDKLRKYRNYDIWGDAYRRPKIYKKLIEDDCKKPFIRKDARR